MSGVPRQEGEDYDVEEKQPEDVVEGETVFALARRVHRHPLAIKWSLDILVKSCFLITVFTQL